MFLLYYRFSSSPMVAAPRRSSSSPRAVPVPSVTTPFGPRHCSTAGTSSARTAWPRGSIGNARAHCAGLRSPKIRSGGTDRPRSWCNCTETELESDHFQTSAQFADILRVGKVLSFDTSTVMRVLVLLPCRVILHQLFLKLDISSFPPTVEIRE